MFATIPYHVIALTVVALIGLLGFIKYWPPTNKWCGVWLKRIEYYQKRGSINRTFKKREDTIAYSTFFKSFCSMSAAQREAGDRYRVIVAIRYDALIALNAMYQPYFTEKLEYHPPK